MRRMMIAAMLLAVFAWSSPAVSGDGNLCGKADLRAFAFESLTISTTALGFTKSAYDPLGAPVAIAAIVTIETADARYRTDGLNPTAAIGHIAVSGSTLTVCGTGSIRTVRFIRKDATDAVFRVTFYRSLS